MSYLPSPRRIESDGILRVRWEAEHIDLPMARSSAMIIEPQQIDHLVLGLTACRKVHSVQPLDLQRAKERFGHSIGRCLQPASDLPS
jgi:hypothetical protein